MRKIILASHGGLAEGALDSARMIMGNSAEVSTYSLQPGGSATDFAQQLAVQLAAEPNNEFIIAADLYGASVCSGLYPLTAYPNVRLFAGFNLCLLLELLSDCDTPMDDEDARILVERARSGIRLVEFKQKTVVAEEDF